MAWCYCQQAKPAGAYLFDIYPTLCDLIGADIPDSVEGRSLLPSLQGDDAGRESLYFAYTECQRAVKQGQFKLIEYAVEGRDRVSQLFDVVNDPFEMTNLIDDLAHQPKVETLRAELLRLRDEWQDTERPISQAFWSRVEFAKT